MLREDEMFPRSSAGVASPPPEGAVAEGLKVNAWSRAQLGDCSPFVLPSPPTHRRPKCHNRGMSPTLRTASTAGFDSLGLSESLLKAVTALGYEEATPVQRATIPLMLAGKDLLAQAATGTGKTAAFALPMIQMLVESKQGTGAAAGRKGRLKTQGLVLVPTRELAMQVAEATHKYARGSGLIVVPLYGGASMMQQIRALERGADIVVGTPGRILDHLRRQSLVLDGVRVLVLDE